MSKNVIKAAIIDLYDNEPNEGIRCIKQILVEAELPFDHFETRYKDEIPEMNYDIFISSGGPGDPFDGEGKSWEKKYFNLLDQINNSNEKNNDDKKFVFFICHSFQLMTRYYKFADVNKRPVDSFGVIPFSLTDEGKNDIIFKGLPDPLYAADFRTYQVINKNNKVLDELGAKILSTEFEDETGQKAIMAVRINDEIAGTQFHPEADPGSMRYHLKKEERRKQVTEKYGEEKYFEMLKYIDQPDKIILTRKTILPNFLNQAINKLTVTHA
ncbi:MAG TPA: hypothetical protein VKA26_14825 [Ignavibacteriaceae bacterium]|nr:hypothetical protein [Ignavibacteriaceae bacterium]